MKEQNSRLFIVLEKNFETVTVIARTFFFFWVIKIYFKMFSFFGKIGTKEIGRTKS